MNDTRLLKTIENALGKMENLPSTTTALPFPWEEFSKELAKTFEQKSCKVTHHKTNETDEALEGMGQAPFIEPLVLSPVPETFFLIIPQKTQKELTAILLGKGLSDSTIEEGFMKFTILNLLETFNRLAPFGNLFASLADEAPLPEKAKSMDISIQFDEKTVWVRIIVPAEAETSFQTFFTAEKPSFLESPEIAALPLSLSLEVGTTEITSEEWSQIKVGDFLLLDRCSYDFENGKGTAQLCLESSPLFTLRIKESETKILQHAFAEESPPIENLSEPSSEKEEEKPLWSAENGGEKSPPDAPFLTLHAEMARIEMPVSKIVALKPEESIDFGINFTTTIFLSTKGKRVAKAELIQLGDVIGVRLLKKGE